ncbi:unnamed protein product [Schistosoma margrebowiei]|uniref:t-SNARE coiled-coil homology domain-containing protein n=1 Tax=Schistosoma margrebowiei TaxID=48269 RepID=A0AA85ABD7_9TREM|nr:unnamed protein product [Schistosoma margrebowiei]
MAKDLFAVLRQNNELPNLPSSEEAVIVDGGSQMDLFFSEIEWIRREIEKTRIEISQVKTKHGEILSALQQNPKTKTQLEELNESITRSAKEIRLKLKSLEQTIREQEAKDATSADLRIRKTQFLTLSKTITTIMHQYGRIQIEHKERCKALLKRQLEVAQRSVTDNELENMLESGNPQIFTQGIITDTQQARQNLADIEARHEDIMKLEKSIRELHDLFIDMASLIETQGELVDRIDVNVKQTQDYVAEARQETKKAVVYKKKSRKKMIILVAIGSGVSLILFIILLSTVIPKV